MTEGFQEFVRQQMAGRLYADAYNEACDLFRMHWAFEQLEEQNRAGIYGKIRIRRPTRSDWGWVDG